MIILKWEATTHEISRENNYHTRDQVPETTPRKNGGGPSAREVHLPPQRQLYLSNRARVRRFLAREHGVTGLFYASHGLTRLTETELVWGVTLQDELRDLFDTQVVVALATKGWVPDWYYANTPATPATPRDAPTTPARVTTPRNADTPATQPKPAMLDTPRNANTPATPATPRDAPTTPARLTTPRNADTPATQSKPTHVSNYDREQHPGPHFTALASHIIDPWLPPPLAAA